MPLAISASDSLGHDEASITLQAGLTDGTSAELIPAQLRHTQMCCSRGARAPNCHEPARTAHATWTMWARRCEGGWKGKATIRSVDRLMKCRTNRDGASVDLELYTVAQSHAASASVHSKPTTRRCASLFHASSFGLPFHLSRVCMYVCMYDRPMAHRLLDRGVESRDLRRSQ
ncbi:hypothetical protein LX32DRAFT_444611 [Colletotrichum zoysiae]|uniref:Uncharacterized protein n=1 Tax=Colletotrichum zoysiae TaxID=1216348 RepID=A0AAD9M8W3_9PEZI|nr:hypothetical protein LX32DRAFT_444611 [Colletotrichum zoysiae]